MEIIALEEHYCPSEVSAAWRGLPADLRNSSQVVFDNGETNRCLEDLGELRLRHMDEMGVDVQVIFLTAPATQVLDAGEAVRLARLSNDRRRGRSQPTRTGCGRSRPCQRPTRRRPCGSWSGASARWA